MLQRRTIKRGEWKAAERRASIAGGFGVVRFGRYKGQWAVSKTVQRASVAVVTELQVFQRIGKSKHPHIVELLDWSHEPARDEAVLYLEAGCIDLFEHVARRPLAHEVVRQVFSQLASGVFHLVMSHIAHLDIKLENVVVTHADGATGALHVKLIDFGLSHVYTPSDPPCSLTRMRGSPTYAAPEVQTASKDKPYSGFAADVWSLGICLYALQFMSFAWERAVADDRNFQRLMLDDQDKDLVSSLRAVHGDAIVDRSDPRAHAVLNGALTLLSDDGAWRRWDIHDVLADDYVLCCPWC